MHEVVVSSVEVILLPIALFSSLSRRGLGTRIEGLWRHRIQSKCVLDSRTSGVHVCSRDVSIYSMGLKMAAVEAVFEESQPRPQGLLLDDFQNGGSSRRSAILKIVEEKALGTRLRGIFVSSFKVAYYSFSETYYESLPHVSICRVCKNDASNLKKQ